MKVIRQIPFKHDVVTLPRLSQYNPLNPSLIVQGDTVRAIYRGCNYNLRKTGYQKYIGSVPAVLTDTQNYTAELTTSLEVKGVDFLEDRHVRARSEALDGIQDLKLFEWKHRRFAVGSGCNSRAYLLEKASTRTFRMMLFEIKGRHLQWIATLPSAGVQEKNWMPWVKDGELYFLHRPNPFRLLRYDSKAKSVHECRSGIYACLEPECSGGSCIVPVPGGYLGLIHKKHGTHDKARYTHQLIRLSGDMRITQASEPFTFENEQVEYGSGLAVNGDDIYLGYGVYDERATILRTGHRQLVSWLAWQDCQETPRS